MLVVGLPHGAVDHLIHIQLKRQNELTLQSLLRFVSFYVALLLLYGTVWFFFPTMSLIFFILLSCYHFGQSQWYYFFSSSPVLSGIVYILWGLAVLSYIVLWNSSEALLILNSLIPTLTRDNLSEIIGNKWSQIPTLLSIIPAIFLSSKFRTFPKSVIFWEVVSLLAIGLVSYFCGLLVGFAAYFGFWHSTKSLAAIVRNLRSVHPGYSLSQFYKDAFVFSFISIAGIVLLLLSLPHLDLGIHPVMLFFVLISLLTFPHMVILEQLYSRPK